VTWCYITSVGPTCPVNLNVT